jgi:predicted nuclease of restriction endonuclease-like (RecB) superfamily
MCSKTPYLLDVLGLKDNFAESDLEKAIHAELEIGKFKPQYKGQMELYLKV